VHTERQRAAQHVAAAVQRPQLFLTFHRFIGRCAAAEPPKKTNAMTKLYRLFLGLLVLTVSSCIHVPQDFKTLPPGMWRGVLMLDPSTVTPNPKGKPLAEKMALTFEEVTKGELPFEFELNLAGDSLVFVFINGDQRIETRDVELWHDSKVNRDSIRIHFKAYNSYLQAAYRENVMDGAWVRLDRDSASTPFMARHGQNYRFSTNRKEHSVAMSGRWAVMFNDERDSFPAIAEFKQQPDGRLSGTFRTETGDFGYLGGQVLGDKLYLSGFDGAHAFLFEAKMVDGQLNGMFRSGSIYRASWFGRRDDAFELADPLAITKVVKKQPVSFNLLDSEGQTFDSKNTFDKPTVIQIMGTWCPNCKDETVFLREYRQKHPEVDFNVVALGFEYADNPEAARTRLKNYKATMGADWPFLHAGKANKEVASAMFPMLSGISSFPTMLILDKRGEIRYVHTGFDGPATSKYTDFTTDFDSKMRALTAENL
jgi:thiol-disulfide isomerase/thioredoxin